jgi:hypothetical protein
LLAVCTVAGLALGAGCGDWTLYPKERDPDCDFNEYVATNDCDGNAIVTRTHYTVSSCGPDKTDRHDCANTSAEGQAGAVCLHDARTGDAECIVPCTTNADCSPTAHFTYFCFLDLLTTDGRGWCSGTYGDGGPCMADDWCAAGLVCGPPEPIASGDGGDADADAASSSTTRTCQRPSM